jgi:hypothetical protein
VRLIVNPRACPTCGCFAFEDDPIDGLVCMLCSRPYVQPNQARLRLIPDEQADIESVIDRERSFIRAAEAAGRRTWS